MTPGHHLPHTCLLPSSVSFLEHQCYPERPCWVSLADLHFACPTHNLPPHAAVCRSPSRKPTDCSQHALSLPKISTQPRGLMAVTNCFLRGLCWGLCRGVQYGSFHHPSQQLWRAAITAPSVDKANIPRPWPCGLLLQLRGQPHPETEAVSTIPKVGCGGHTSRVTVTFKVFSTPSIIQTQAYGLFPLQNLLVN